MRSPVNFSSGTMGLTLPYILLLVSSLKFTLHFNPSDLYQCSFPSFMMSQTESLCAQPLDSVPNPGQSPRKCVIQAASRIVWCDWRDSCNVVLSHEPVTGFLQQVIYYSRELPLHFRIKVYRLDSRSIWPPK